MRSSDRSRRGFSLIEVLVVVVIAGIISAVVLLSLGIIGDDRGLKEEARRLSSLIGLATDEAVMQGREFGLEIMRGGYRFVEYDPLTDEWHEVVGDDMMRQRQLEAGMEFELVLEDRIVELAEKAAEMEAGEETVKTDSTNDYLPHVLILSSGEVTPFNLAIIRQADDAQITLAMNLAGKIEVRSDDENPL